MIEINAGYIYNTFLKDYIHPNDIDLPDEDKQWLFANNYYDYYYEFGRTFKPSMFLEIGVRYGYSALCMVKGVIDSGNQIDMMIGIDSEIDGPCNEYSKSKLDMFIKDVKIISKQTEHITEEEIKSHSHEKLFDIIHMDASHSYKTLREFELSLNLLNPGGILIIDDVGSFNTNTDWLHAKKSYLDGFLWYNIYHLNKISWFHYYNSYRGTYVIKKK